MRLEREKKKGGGDEKVREGETTEGWFAGACARVNDTVLSVPSLQLRLSEQQCCCVEHENQLAGARRGSVLMGSFLQFIVLLYAKEKEQRSKFYNS